MQVTLCVMHILVSVDHAVKYKKQFHINLTALVFQYFHLLSENIKLKIYKTMILSVPRPRMVELYLHSPILLHGIVLN